MSRPPPIIPPVGTVVYRFWHGAGGVSWYDLPEDAAETCPCGERAARIYFKDRLRARSRIYRCTEHCKHIYASELVREWPAK